MGYLPKELEELFRRFEEGPEALSEMALGEAVGEWLTENQGLDSALELAATAEKLAFTFQAFSKTGQSEWGTYYGPFGSGIDPKGRKVNVPDISEVSQSILDYWKGRSEEAKHPILGARYADLVWDFSKPVTGKGASHQSARVAIKAYVEAADSDLHRLSGESVRRLQRALSLALSLRDDELVTSVRKSMLSFFRRNAAPGKIGVWCSLFDTLCGNKRVPLTVSEAQELIKTLEGLLRRTCERCNKDFDPWAAKAAAMCLAKHYRNAGRPEDATRVIRTYGTAFETLADEADPLFGMNWLEELYGEYRAAGMKADAERVQTKCKAKGKQAEKSLKTMSFAVEVPRAELSSFLDSITEGGVEKALRRVAFSFVVKEGEARTQLADIAKDHPLLVAIPHALMSEQQTVAEIGPLDQDPGGRIALQITDNITFNCLFLVLSLQRLTERYGDWTGDMLDHLSRSPLFSPERRSLLERGVSAYLEGDHTVAMHILIPQMEQAIRRLLEEVGMPTNKPSRGRGMQEKNIYDMLSDLYARQPTLHEYLPYLVTLLADPRGLNLRNRLCHGLMISEDFSPQNSALVLHALLFLGYLRIEEGPGDGAPE